MNCKTKILHNSKCKGRVSSNLLLMLQRGVLNNTLLTAFIYDIDSKYSDYLH